MWEPTGMGIASTTDILHCGFLPLWRLPELVVVVNFHNLDQQKQQ
jgi:hypothetical protein